MNFVRAFGGWMGFLFVDQKWIQVDSNLALLTHLIQVEFGKVHHPVLNHPHNFNQDPVI